MKISHAKIKADFILVQLVRSICKNAVPFQLSHWSIGINMWLEIEPPTTPNMQVRRIAFFFLQVEAIIYDSNRTCLFMADQDGIDHVLCPDHALGHLVLPEEGGQNFDLFERV